MNRRSPSSRSPLVQVFGARSPFLPLQKAIFEGRVALAFSTAILLEYEEVLTRYGGPNRWSQVWRALELTGQIHDNLRSPRDWEFVGAETASKPYTHGQRSSPGSGGTSRTLAMTRSNPSQLPRLARSARVSR